MVRDDVEAAVEELRATGAERIGGLGLSVGGHFLFYGAAQVAFDSLAVLYPGWLTTPTFPFAGPEPTLDLAAHQTRTLVLVGADDHLVDAAPIEKRLAEEGVDHEVVVYPETPHGYFCDERDTWRPGAAADTWAKGDDAVRWVTGGTRQAEVRTTAPRPGGSPGCTATPFPRRWLA